MRMNRIDIGRETMFDSRRLCRMPKNKHEKSAKSGVRVFGFGLDKCGNRGYNVNVSRQELE